MTEVEIPKIREIKKDERLQKIKYKVGFLKRFYYLYLKNLKDLMNLKRFIIYLLILVIIPVSSIYNGAEIQNYAIRAASYFFSYNLIGMFYFWGIGLPFCILLTSSAAGQICDEIRNGTMIMLISKPISRVQIFFGKYLAVFTFSVILSTVSLFLIGWFVVLINTGNIWIFIYMIPYLLSIVLYSVFVTFFFTSITMALSAIMSRGRSVAVLMLIIIMGLFLGTMIVRLIAYDKYLEYYIYLFDITTYLAYILTGVIQFTGSLPWTSMWQYNLNMFTSIFQTTSGIDLDQGIPMGGYQLKEFLSINQAFIILTVICIVLMIFGLYILKKKEIR